jgi:hypothetical protein
LGRQLGIYFTKEDCQNLLDFAKTTGNVVALPWRSPTSDFAAIETVDDKNLGFFLFNRGVSSNLVTQYVTQQGYYVIDSLQSSVIEYSGSSKRDNAMFPGRIWADFTFLNNERTALLPKEPEFSKWYDTIGLWIKKHSERVVWTDPIRRKTSVIGYAGVGAQKFYDSGGRLAINAPSVKPLDEKLLGRILYHETESYRAYLHDIVRRRLAPPADRIKLTCQLCGDRFVFGSRDLLHRVRENDWTIYCPKVCPGCGEKRKLQGGVYSPTHSCGWDVMKSDTYHQKDYAPIDKNELQGVKTYLRIE